MVNRRGKLSRKTWWVFIINCTRLPFDCSLYILQPFWRWKRLRYLPMYSCEGNDLFFFYFHWNIILLEVNRTWEYFVFVVSSLPEAISHFKLRSKKPLMPISIFISRKENIWKQFISNRYLMYSQLDFIETLVYTWI